MYKNISIRKKATCKYCYSIFLDPTDRSSRMTAIDATKHLPVLQQVLRITVFFIKSKRPMGGLEFVRDDEAITGDLGRNNNDRVTMRKTRDSNR